MQAQALIHIMEQFSAAARRTAFEDADKGLARSVHGLFVPPHVLLALGDSDRRVVAEAQGRSLRSDRATVGQNPALWLEIPAQRASPRWRDGCTRPDCGSTLGSSLRANPFIRLRK
jgi:hypothetical protein